MSTQHPDNVRPPFFADSTVIGGDDEIKEAFYAFSHIDCREQLWDFEGKEVDNYVVKKLLTKYEPFFQRRKLGRDVFLTLRVPNPGVERGEAKILLETLESIPRSYDVARAFYGEDIAPIFEITLPMATSAIAMRRIKEYYRKMIVGRENQSIIAGDIPISQWIGEFNPKDINVIPLFEDHETILNAAKITEEYLKGQDIAYQRVWLARSDPALNYSSLAAVLMIKIGLQRLHLLQEKSSVEIFPILGTGSAPFRGNLKPTNAGHILKAYPSVQTFTIQSAFKYDYSEDLVQKAVRSLAASPRGRPIEVEEAAVLPIIKKLSEEYQKQVSLLSGMVNDFSRYIPPRRKRKLHIGLFGYSRSLKGIKLPRAITFAASLYSIGLPPEILGLNVLSARELDAVRSITPHLDEDMQDALQFFNKDSLGFLPNEIQKKTKQAVAMFKFDVDPRHKKVTDIIREDYHKKNLISLEENITRAASIRGFLG
ncbi:phosphoenolpyruvate carboxylase [Candidatus Woesearchaeota archaeon]|nr:phosphoenolpyruvate carboxylase [Candidatus Woesearchaeota archaeon]